MNDKTLNIALLLANISIASSTLNSYLQKAIYEHESRGEHILSRLDYIGDCNTTEEINQNLYLCNVVKPSEEERYNSNQQSSSIIKTIAIANICLLSVSTSLFTAIVAYNSGKLIFGKRDAIENKVENEVDDVENKVENEVDDVENEVDDVSNVSNVSNVLRKRKSKQSETRGK